MAISEELKKVYATAPVDNFYIETLSLEHPIFPNGVRYLTNNNGGWIGNLETGAGVVYEFAPFVAIPPAAEDEAALTLQVGLDNSGRQLMDQLETMAQTPSQPIEVVYRVYLTSDPGTLQNNPPLRLWVAAVVATQDIVSFSASTTNLRNTPFPSKLYNIDLYPGLER